jgi:hypothetical protein
MAPVVLLTQPKKVTTAGDRVALTDSAGCWAAVAIATIRQAKVARHGAFRDVVFDSIFIILHPCCFICLVTGHFLKGE